MKTIAQFTFTLLFTFVFIAVHAQFGVRVKYNNNTFPQWEEILPTIVTENEKEIFPNTLEFGVDYWFRLKEYRIEFMPELSYALNATSIHGVKHSAFNYAAFTINTNLYIFDLKGDCDCPTFSKQGPTLKKGLFINIAPTMMFSQIQVKDNDTEEVYKNSEINFKIGAGIGYDIGLSDFFTITPQINYTYTPSINHDPLPSIRYINNGTELPSYSTMNQLQFQLRLGFRPDYVNKYGRRR